MAVHHYVVLYEEGNGSEIGTAEHLQALTRTLGVELESDCGQRHVDHGTGHVPGIDEGRELAKDIEATPGTADECALEKGIGAMSSDMRAKAGGCSTANGGGLTQCHGGVGEQLAENCVAEKKGRDTAQEHLLTNGGAGRQGDGASLRKGKAHRKRGVVHYIPFAQGQTVAQAIYLSGRFVVPALCSGMGRCGYCRVCCLGEYPSQSGMSLDVVAPTLADEEFFSAEGLAQGWRLGCRHGARQGQLVLLPANTQVVSACMEDMENVEDAEDAGNTGKLGEAEKCHGAKPLCEWIAIDVGTTSVHWRAYGYAPENRAPENRTPEDRHGQEHSVAKPVCLDGGVFPNPQMGAGSEVVSRIQMALSAKGRENLFGISRRMFRSIVRRAGEAKAIFLAANPAMAAITLGHDVASLAYAPYALPERGGDWVHVEGLPPIWVAPHMAPFVGGDVSAGYASLLAENAEYPFLLADMGTNGEFVLALSPTRALVASVALGPALEGISLTYGSEAKEGVIVDFSSSPLGFAPVYASPEVYGRFEEDGGMGGGGKALAGGLSGNASTGAPENRDVSAFGGSSINEGAINENAVNKDAVSRSIISDGSASKNAVNDGVVSKSTISEGAMSEEVKGMEAESAKMSGTAYISLLSQLIDGRALSRQGHFLEGGGIFAKFLRQALAKQAHDKETLDKEALGKRALGKREHDERVLGKQVLDERADAKQGLIDATPDNGAPTGRALMERLPQRCLSEPYFPLPRGMYLFASDVEELLKVKAAFSLGLSRLLAHAGIAFHELRHVYLAGALGKHVNVKALENLGFFPPGAHEIIIAMGNAALAGTICLAQDENLRQRVVAWATAVTPVNLAGDRIFQEQYPEHMIFRYVDGDTGP